MTNYSLVDYQYQMKRRFKNSNLSLHDQTWFLKQQKKISLKPLLLYILYNYYNWQLEFLCAYDVRFQSVYNGRNFKKKFFFVLALKFTLLFQNMETHVDCGFFIHFVLLYCFPRFLSIYVHRKNLRKYVLYVSLGPIT